MASNGRPALRGDEQELFRSLSKRLLRSVGRAVNAPEAIVEEACAFAWQRLIECQPERTERIFAWLRKVAIHEVWRLCRRERVAVRLDEPAGPDGDGAGIAVHELIADDRTGLEAKLEAREALERVAALTGDSVRTVDRQLRRAHARVRHGGR